MTEPERSSIDSDPQSHDPALANTVSDDAVVQTQLASNASTANQPTPSAIPTRDWILYLPPELRMMIYGYALQLPFHVPYLPRVWRHADLRALTGILHTSRLIQSEAIDVFYRVNTFSLHPWFPRLSLGPDRPDLLLQNFSIHVALHATRQDQAPHEAFSEILRIFQTPAVIRGTFSVHFSLSLHHRRRSAPLGFFLGCLARLPMFRTVHVDFAYRRRPMLSAAVHCARVQSALRSVLGPASAHATDRGLTFFPQQFLNRPPPLDAMDAGIGSGDEPAADHNVDE